MCKLCNQYIARAASAHIVERASAYVSQLDISDMDVSYLIILAPDAKVCPFISHLDILDPDAFLNLAVLHPYMYLMQIVLDISGPDFQVAGHLTPVYFRGWRFNPQGHFTPIHVAHRCFKRVLSCTKWQLVIHNLSWAVIGQPYCLHLDVMINGTVPIESRVGGRPIKIKCRANSRWISRAEFCPFWVLISDPYMR